MPCTSYCDEELNSYNPIACDDYQLSGVDAVVLFACGSEPADPTDGTEVQNLIDAGNAIKVSNVRIGLPAGSAVTQPSPIAGGTDLTINYDRTATIFDANMTVENNTFWNAALERRFGAALFHNVDADDCFFVNPPSGINTQISPVVLDQNTEFRRYEGQFSWRDKSMPELTASPAGIFS